jgi:hypothetical protein
MKSLIKKIDDLLVAITFAESGEYDSATKILGLKQDDPTEVETLSPELEVV